MDSKLRSALAALPTLERGDANGRRCKLCSGAAALFDVVDFNKVCAADFYCFGTAGIPVAYYRCSVCGFLFTDFFDDWPPEDFARFIYNADYVKVDPDYASIRPERNAAAFLNRFPAARPRRVLDYGGGNGVFAAALRKAGMTAETYDPFSSIERPERRFDLLTSFEVMEHSPAPRETMRDMAGFLESGGCMLAETLLQPPDIGALRGNWWYVAPRNGHVSIYSRDALAVLARSAGLVFHEGGGGLGFASPDPSAESKQLLATLGCPYFFVTLFSPDSGAARETNETARSDLRFWHGLESRPFPYRWTSQTETQWTLSLPPVGPCRVKFALGYIMEIEPGFSAACRLAVAGASMPLQPDGRFLTATFDIKGGTSVVVTLQTPLPRKPSDLGRDVADARPLGIAVPTGPPATTV